MNSRIGASAFAALALLAISLVGLSLWQYRQIAGLRSALAQSETAQADANRHAAATAQRLAAAEKSQTDTAAELQALRDRPASAAPAPAQAVRTRNAAAVLDNPAMQKMMAATFKAQLDQRYGALFRRLKLSPGELDAFKNLLAERQMSALDVMRAAQSQGINLASNPAELPALMKTVEAEVDGSIRTLIGDQRFEQYQDFNRNIASYALLDQIERRLSYTDVPLQSAQSEALLRVLVETAPPGNTPRAAMAGIAQSFAGASPLVAAMTQGPISNATIARAESVLQPTQVEALRQLQAEQQAQIGSMQGLRGGAGFAVPAEPAARQ